VRSTIHTAPHYAISSSPMFLFPQPMSFLQCETERFTPMSSNKQRYSYVYFNVYISVQQKGRQIILDRNLAGIPSVQSALYFFIKF